MTWPGAPTLYYGDEAGLVGWTDPDNRRTYPWGHEDQGLIEMYRGLARLRKELPVLRLGSVKPLCAGHGFIAYARFDAEGIVTVACNNTERPVTLVLPLRDVGVPDGTKVALRFLTTADGFSEEISPVGEVQNGVLRYEAAPFSAMVMVNEAGAEAEAEAEEKEPAAAAS
jgi:alpha-glucosidase